MAVADNCNAVVETVHVATAVVVLVPAGARQMKNTNRKKLMFVWTRYAHAAAVKLEIIRGGIDCNGYDGEVGHCGHKRIR